MKVILILRIQVPRIAELDPQTYKNWKDYAVLEAGRSRIVLQ